jgi:hypothetical protein
MRIFRCEEVREEAHNRSLGKNTDFNDALSAWNAANEGNDVKVIYHLSTDGMRMLLIRFESGTERHIKEVNAIYERLYLRIVVKAEELISTPYGS